MLVERESKMTKTNNKKAEKLLEETETLIIKQFMKGEKIGETTNIYLILNLMRFLIYAMDKESMCLHRIKDALNDSYKFLINFKKEELKEASKSKVVN